MKGFDKWLTTNPFDENDGYFEAITDAYTDEFYDKQEGKFILSDKETDIINKCAAKEYPPEYAAKIIERLHKLYKL